MSATFMWEIVKPSKAKYFTNGTNSDQDALKQTFPRGEISTKQINILKAMHRATRLDHSLWSDIADVLERLQGEDYENESQIRVWVEY